MSKVIEHNVLTGKIVERPMTADELANLEQRRIDAENAKITQDEAASKRQALLDKLGITEEEAKLLLS